MTNGFTGAPSRLLITKELSTRYYDGSKDPGLVCEYHLGYGRLLSLVALHNPTVVRLADPWMRASIDGPIYICQDCKKNLAGLFRDIIIFTEEKKMKVSEFIVGDKKQIQMAQAFVELKDKFNGITNVFIVPHEHLQSKYRDGLNISLELDAFSVLSYTAWALKEHKSVMHLWNTPVDRSKFWSTKVTRLLIALGRIDHDTNGLHIWIRSYGRLFHINHFVCQPQKDNLYKFIPGRLIRLDK